MRILELGVPTEPEGFSYAVARSGDVFIEHHGRPATALRGAAAAKFIARAAVLDEQQRQHLMARSTGSYRRGNESFARVHPRNR